MSSSILGGVRRLASSGLAVAVAATVGAGVAFAQIPGTNGVISACYTKSTGTIRVIDAGAACKSSESPLSWNQTGVQGPAGPAGTTGPQGPAGPGATTYVVQQTDVIGFGKVVQVACHDGDTATGGGFVAPDGVRVLQSHPTGPNSMWLVQYEDPANGGATVITYVVCLALA